MALQIHQDTQRKLDGLPEALYAEFPHLPHELVRWQVETITRGMVANARIEEFVPVLVHRFAREQLLEVSQASEVASQSGLLPDGPG